MITRTAYCIDIWTEEHDNPLRFEAFPCNGKTMWHLYEDYLLVDECGYDHIDFCGTFAECIEVMHKYINMEVSR